jgi:general secretion pathway protein B
MSFILDALKKSEIERQRQSVPGLIDVPAAQRRRGIPAWGWVLAGLLGVNVAVLLVVLIRSPAAPGAAHPLVAVAEPPASQQPSHDLTARPASTPAAAEGTDHFSPLDNAPVYAPEIPVPGNTESRAAGQESPGRDSAAAPNAVASAPRAVAPQADLPARAARRADPVLNDEPSDDNEMLPSISELNLTGNQSLPEIHLDVHVYATRTADRFVYINMRKYREGAVLQEGPTLERIRRDGVVLNYNGLRFFVPRQS